MLGFPIRALIQAPQRRYEPGLPGMAVPNDLLAHPFLLLASDSPLDEALIQHLFTRYPVHDVLQVHDHGGRLWKPGVVQDISDVELSSRFYYRPLISGREQERLQQWIDGNYGYPSLCRDEDYAAQALHDAYACLLAVGMGPQQALLMLGQLMVGLAAVSPIPAKQWCTPRVLFHSALQCTSFVISHDLAEGLLWNLEDEVLWQLAYRLAPVDWRCISWDYFGPLFTSNLDDCMRQKQGVFFTPPELVDMVLDQVGVFDNLEFDGAILEPCAGTGAFVVRLLARARIMAAPNGKSKAVLARLLHSLTAIEYEEQAWKLLYLNVAIQWAIACGDELEPLPRTYLYRGDALQAYSTFDDLPIGEQEELVFNPITTLPSESRCCATVDELRHRRNFAFVLGNPPYVGESGHRQVFAAYRRHPFWKHFSESKMDFLQYFIVLGLSKIQGCQVGRLGFLTSAYWLTADGAAHLRDFILNQACISRVIYINSKRSLFDDAPGHHNAIVLLKREADAATRNANYVRTARLVIDHHRSEPSLGKPAVGNGPADETMYPEPQLNLQGKPWFLTVVAEHLDVLSILEKNPCLATAFVAKQGVAPGAQRVGPKELAFLGEQWVADHHITDDEGIFVLTQQEVAALHLSSDETVYLRPFIKNSAIKPYRVQPNEPLWLIYLRHDTVTEEDCPQLIRHLARFKPLLTRKREYHLGLRDWYHLHWPREEDIFVGEKVVTAQRAVRPAFAWSGSPLYAATDVYFLTPRATTDQELRPSLLALTGILNSSLGHFWFAHRTKAKGVQREFFSGALQSFPLPPVSLGYGQRREWSAAHERLEAAVRVLQQANWETPSSRHTQWLEQVNEAVFCLYRMTDTDTSKIRSWMTCQQPLT